MSQIPVIPHASTATIKKAERLLKAAGFSPGKIDGKPTANTQAALTEFQTAMGMSATGTVDAKTVKALEQVHRRQVTHKDGFEGQGQKNKKILELEKQLRRDGYAVGKADGIYDRQTTAAVKELKQDHKDLTSRGGSYFGNPGQTDLRKDLKARGHTPEHRRVQLDAAQKMRDRATAAAAGATAADGATGLGEGSKGATVRNVQRHLAAAGYPVGKQDGKYDGHVAASVRAMQKAAKLPITGRVDAATWKELKKSLQPKNSAMTKGERSHDVLKAELMLRKLGFNVGKVDGLFDAALQRASRKFENKHKGTGNDGAIGDRQLKAMKKALKDQQSAVNKKLVKFYSTAAGYKKVFDQVVHGWFGTTHNACVAFVTTALKDVGVKFPANGGKWGNVRTFTTDMSRYLQQHEHWKKISSGGALKPGDVVLTQPEPGLSFPAHTYMFKGWADKAHSVALVVDNQGFTHKRNINAGGGGFNFTPFAYALRAP
jgi:peptidoglycan hydrolase-like protein with peptidoglycan-binding domain